MASKPMTAAEVEALERVIVRARGAIPAIEMAFKAAGKRPPAFDDVIEKLRSIAVTGMTAAEARKVVKATDTEAERETVRKWQSVLATKADADLLTRAVLRMAREALADKPQEAPNTGEAIQFASDFLFGWPGGRCDLFLLSTKTTDAERAANRAHKDRYDLTTYIPYLRNDGDGDGKHPVDSLSDIQRVRELFAAMRREGRAIVPIIFSDSHRTSDHAGYASRCVKAFDDLVDGWIIYLEPNDTANDATVNAVGRAVRGLTKKLVGIQTHSIGGTKADTSKMHWVSQAWCDFVAVQISHPDKPIARKDVAAVWRNLMRASNGKLVIPFEYSWESDDYLLGDEFAKQGASALGDGCSRDTVAKLPRILRTVSSAEAPVVTDIPATEAVAFKMDDPKKRYVSWKGVSRNGWKAHKVDGKDCDGRLYLNGKFCEHIPVGRDNTGIRNALTRGKDQVNVRKGYYQPSLRKGQLVTLEIRPIDGKSRNLIGSAVMAEDAEQ